MVVEEETADGKLRSLLWPGKHPRPFRAAFTSFPKCRNIGRLCPGNGPSKVGRIYHQNAVPNIRPDNVKEMNVCVITYCYQCLIGRPRTPNAASCCLERVFACVCVSGTFSYLSTAILITLTTACV